MWCKRMAGILVILFEFHHWNVYCQFTYCQIYTHSICGSAMLAIVEYEITAIRHFIHMAPNENK